MHRGRLGQQTRPEQGAAHAALAARGVVFEGPPQCIAELPRAEAWLAAFRDGERNLLAQMSEVPTPNLGCGAEAGNRPRRATGRRAA